MSAVTRSHYDLVIVQMELRLLREQSSVSARRRLRAAILWTWLTASLIPRVPRMTRWMIVSWVGSTRPNPRRRSASNESLRRAGRAKGETFISNVVHCHPPKNRGSYVQEIVI